MPNDYTADLNKLFAQMSQRPNMGQVGGFGIPDLGSSLSGAMGQMGSLNTANQSAMAGIRAQELQQWLAQLAADSSYKLANLDADTQKTMQGADIAGKYKLGQLDSDTQRTMQGADIAGTYKLGQLGSDTQKQLQTGNLDTQRWLASQSGDTARYLANLEADTGLQKYGLLTGTIKDLFGGGGSSGGTAGGGLTGQLTGFKASDFSGNPIASAGFAQNPTGPAPAPAPSSPPAPSGGSSGSGSGTSFHPAPFTPTPFTPTPLPPSTALPPIAPTPVPAPTDPTGRGSMNTHGELSPAAEHAQWLSQHPSKLTPSQAAAYWASRGMDGLGNPTSGGYRAAPPRSSGFAAPNAALLAWVKAHSNGAPVNF